MEKIVIVLIFWKWWNFYFCFLHLPTAKITENVRHTSVHVSIFAMSLCGQCQASLRSESVWETEAVIAAGVWIARAACARCQRCGDGFSFSCALSAGLLCICPCCWLPTSSFIYIYIYIKEEVYIYIYIKRWKIWHLKHFICSFPSPLSTSDISIIYCLQ